MTANYFCLGLALALIFLVAALGIRTAVQKAVRTPRSELQRALRRNGISVAILGTADHSLLWTEAAGYVDDKSAAAAVSHTTAWNFWTSANAAWKLRLRGNC